MGNDEVEMIHIGDLRPLDDSENPRKHNPKNIGQIVASLQALGAARSIVIDENNNILAGNGTIEAASEIGLTKLKVIETDGEEIIAVRRRNMSEVQKRQYAVADNRTTDTSVWNKDALELYQLAEIDLIPWFTPEELDDLVMGTLPQTTGDGNSGLNGEGGLSGNNADNDFTEDGSGFRLTAIFDTMEDVQYWTETLRNAGAKVKSNMPA
jgi:hypothetical protein